MWVVVICTCGIDLENVTPSRGAQVCPFEKTLHRCTTNTISCKCCWCSPGACLRGVHVVPGTSQLALLKSWAQMTRWSVVLLVKCRCLSNLGPWVQGRLFLFEVGQRDLHVPEQPVVLLMATVHCIVWVCLVMICAEWSKAVRPGKYVTVSSTHAGSPAHTSAAYPSGAPMDCSVSALFTLKCYPPAEAWNQVMSPFLLKFRRLEISSEGIDLCPVSALETWLYVFMNRYVKTLHLPPASI
jgi:hypothetical protein